MPRNDSKWTEELPNMEGWWWFYGKRFKSSKVRLQMVQAKMSVDSLVLVCDGVFIYPPEMGPGKFLYIEPPTPPEKSN